MAEQTPSTKRSALDKVNVARLAAHVKRSIDDLIAPFNPTYGSSLGDILRQDPGEQLKKVTSEYLEAIKGRKAIEDFRIGPIRRQLFKDIYWKPADRATALKVFWRARKTKERLYWEEGQALTDEQYAEFGHLLQLVLWGMNDDVSGYVQLRKPSGYIMDMFITPVMPVNYISLNLEIKDGQVQLP